MARVLIIDDDLIICNVLSKKIERLGHEVQCSNTISSGLKIAKNCEFDIVFLDVRLPDGNGLEILSGICQGPTPPEVIIITGDCDPECAETAIRNGAWDYIQKPSSLKSMVFPLIRALQYREKRKTTASPKALKVNGIIGTSSRIKTCLDQVAHASDSELSVLITGETGTGKELFARAIHDNSARAKARFVTVDCASLPENLVESELFGSVKGAFSGATANREGLIKRADGGTLFLDEVGEMPLAIQKKFLRVLQEHRFRPVGDNREIASDFRLVCATNQDLDAMVRDGSFRQDLHYRLKAMHIELPALRDRSEDIKGLAMHHMNKICDHYRMPTKGMTPEFVEALMNYDWPGNVREILNTMENVLVGTKDEPVLYPQHLPMNLRVKAKQASLQRDLTQNGFSNEQSCVQSPADTDEIVMSRPVSPAEALEGEPENGPVGAVPAMEQPAPVVMESVMPASGSFPTLRELREATVGAMENKYLAELLERSDGDLSTALRLSGLSRARFYELLKKHSISFRINAPGLQSATRERTESFPGKRALGARDCSISAT